MVHKLGIESGSPGSKRSTTKLSFLQCEGNQGQNTLALTITRCNQWTSGGVTHLWQRIVAADADAAPLPIILYTQRTPQSCPAYL